MGMVAFRGSTNIDVSHDARSHRCTGTVAADSHTIKLLGIHQMGGEQESEVRSTIALANGHLLVRSNGK